MRDSGYTSGFGFMPLLFLIYINDLPQCLEHTNPNMFPDNTQIETSGYDIDVIVEKLNQNPENVSTRLSADKLVLNSTKTEYMIKGRNRRVKVIDICTLCLMYI